jgi:hypothetical protein
MSLLTKMQTIKFTQSWGGVEWISKQKYERSELEKQISSIYTPNDNVYDALSSMFNAYYPNELLIKSSHGGNNLEYNDEFPWEHHKHLHSMYHPSNENKYKEELRKILTNDWILSWHWRAVLPTLEKWDSSDKTKTVIIQISHFRKWEMLLCYYVSTSKLNELKSLKEIPLSDKILLRAPLFGISHRLKGWDTYRLFYINYVKAYIDKKIKHCKKKPHKIDLPTILGRHDCYYIIDNVMPGKIKNSFDWSLKCSIETEPEISKIDKKILKNKTYKKPLDFIEIPSFGDKHNGIPQLLASDNYCEAIYELMEILNDPTAKSVLLVAPPGSGKEKLAEFVFHCRESEKRGEFIATTLAGLNATEVSKLLFSCSKSSIKSKIENLKPRPNDGLILRALDGALFIDEIDKTDKSVRDLLLRVLESGEITDPETSIIINIGKRRPLYIFSGSMSRKNMFQEAPPDFWTRISHIIEVSHPLAIDDIDKSKKVVKDYLWMFWSQHVIDFMKKRRLIVDNKNMLTKPLINFNLALFKFLLDERTIDFACEILSEEISGRGKPLVSIRTLRAIVDRSLFSFLEVIQFSKFDDEPIEVYKLSKKESLEGKGFDDWFKILLKIISKDLSGKQNNSFIINSIELNVLESFKTAIRLGTKLAQ